MLKKATEIEKTRGMAQGKYIQPNFGDNKEEVAKKIIKALRDNKKVAFVLNAKKETSYLFADILNFDYREINPENKNGYAIIPQLLSGDKVTVILDDSVRKTYASSNVFENTGDCAVEQGPLVYCFEDQDNAGDVLSLSIAENGKTKAEAFDKNLLCGARKISVEGYITLKSRTLYSNSKPEKKPYTLTAIPYYTWGNRGETNMRVWLPER